MRARAKAPTALLIVDKMLVVGLRGLEINAQCSAVNAYVFLGCRDASFSTRKRTICFSLSIRAHVDAKVCVTLLGRLVLPIGEPIAVALRLPEASMVPLPKRAGQSRVLSAVLSITARDGFQITENTKASVHSTPNGKPTRNS